MPERRGRWRQIHDGVSVVNLASELAQKTRVKVLYGGDLLHTTSIVQQLLSKMEDKLDQALDSYQRQQVVEELMNVSPTLSPEFGCHFWTRRKRPRPVSLVYPGTSHDVAV